MKHLSDLLGHNHPLFAYNINQLERAAGYPGIDTRLLADCTEAAHRVIRELRFDSIGGVHADEVHKALMAAVRDGRADKILADTNFVLLRLPDGTVSFNVHDIKQDIDDDAPFEKRSLNFARRNLRAEVIRRYAEHDRTDNDIVRRLLLEAGIDVPDEVDTTKDRATDNNEKNEENTTVDKKPYILCIGDIFTDAFITLGDDTAKIIEQDGKEWLAVPFGSKPPYEKVDIVKSVGPSPNVAVSLSRLGVDSGLMAWIGGDDTGEEAVEYLKTENVDTEPMVIEADKATSYWYVLCYKADRTMLVKSEKYRYEWVDPVRKPEWIYLAYLGEDSWPLHEGLLNYLERNPDIKLALQPGTFQFMWGAEKLSGLYSRSHIVLMNREEAMDVTGRPYDSIKNLADGLHKIGPEIVVITDGPNGSYVSNGSRVLTIPNYPDIAPPVERTGAGDAFSSTFVAALAEGESIDTALLWSPINSMNVVQQVGAQAGLQTREQIEEWLSKAPEYYKVSEHHD